MKSFQKLEQLRNAAEATRHLLYGGAVGGIFEGLWRPKLDLLNAELENLTKETTIDCKELARIIVETYDIKWGPILKPSDARDAATWLICASKGVEERLRIGSKQPLLQAIETGDIRFFKRLCKHLKRPLVDWKRILPLEWHWEIHRRWSPKADWEGLAYFSNAARMEFLRLKLGNRACPSKNALSNFLQRRRFISARKPFVTQVSKQGTCWRLK